MEVLISEGKIDNGTERFSKENANIIEAQTQLKKILDILNFLLKVLAFNR